MIFSYQNEAVLKALETYGFEVVRNAILIIGALVVCILIYLVYDVFFAPSARVMIWRSTLAAFFFVLYIISSNAWNVEFNLRTRLSVDDFGTGLLLIRKIAEPIDYNALALAIFLFFLMNAMYVLVRVLEAHYQAEI